MSLENLPTKEVEKEEVNKVKKKELPN